MATRDRRLGFRVPLEIFLTQYIRDRPVRSLACNLSDTGIYLQSVSLSGARNDQIQGPVALEFELPGTGEVIWARGEVCYEDGDDIVAGTGIRFTGIPTIHARMIRDYCIERRRSHLGELLAQIRPQTSLAV